MTTGKVVIDEGTGTDILAQDITSAPLVGTTITGKAGVVELIGYDGSSWHVVPTDTSGNLSTNVVGNIAAGSADSGAPVKIGGKYNSTKPTLTDGQRGDTQLGTRGSLAATLYAADSTNAINAANDNADAVATSANARNLAVLGRNTVYNGTTWDRLPGDTTGVKIQDGGNSITIDGTVTAITNVVHVDDNSGSLTVDNGGTFAVQATVAAGATTIAKAEDVASADGDVGVPAYAIRKATPANTSGTDGDYEPLQVLNGKLWVQGTVAEDSASADGDIGVPAMAVRKATPANTSGTDGDYEPLQVSAGKLWTQGTYAEDSAHVNADVGVFVMAVRDDTLNSTSGTEGDYEALHTTATGALWVTQTTSTTGGWSVFNATSSDGATALTSTAQAIKASAGTLGGWYIYNPNATAQYVQLYNTAQGSVTVGTTNPLFMLTIPATSATNIEFGNGINFSTAISCSATSTAGGNGAPSTALDAVFYYA